MAKYTDTAIVIVAYNNPSLLVKQVECINKFCTDTYEIWVIDNSTDQEAIDGMVHHSERLGCQYMKTTAGSKGGSLSHAFAANVSYLQLKEKYDYFLYLDHDCFPIRNFSVIETLGKKVIAGIGQDKSRTYFWPGCVMFATDDAIDFSCNSVLALDTGGNLYKMIDKHGIDGCIFFNERYYENDQFNTESRYNYYTTINDDMFMHFVNGSNWSKTNDNEERINSLINILSGIIKNN